MSEHWLQELSAFLCEVMVETVRKLKVITKGNFFWTCEIRYREKFEYFNSRSGKLLSPFDEALLNTAYCHHISQQKALWLWVLWNEREEAAITPNPNVAQSKLIVDSQYNTVYITQSIFLLAGKIMKVLV